MWFVREQVALMLKVLSTAQISIRNKGTVSSTAVNYASDIVIKRTMYFDNVFLDEQIDSEHMQLF